MLFKQILDRNMLEPEIIYLYSVVMQDALSLKAKRTLEKLRGLKTDDLFLNARIDILIGHSFLVENNVGLAQKFYEGAIRKLREQTKEQTDFLDYHSRIISILEKKGQLNTESEALLEWLKQSFEGLKKS